MDNLIIARTKKYYLYTSIELISWNATINASCCYTATLIHILHCYAEKAKELFLIYLKIKFPPQTNLQKWLCNAPNMLEKFFCNFLFYLNPFVRKEGGFNKLYKIEVAFTAWYASSTSSISN